MTVAPSRRGRATDLVVGLAEAKRREEGVIKSFEKFKEGRGVGVQTAAATADPTGAQ